VIGGALGRRFARLATNAVLAKPQLWRLVRGPMRRQFHGLAGEWDTILGEDHLESYEAALGAIPTAPRRALDVGTGTGAGAFAIAQRFPDTEVVGVDLARGMVEEARRKTPAALEDRVTFDVGDASKLPFADGSFDLVAHANMIPFFDEVARVVAPGGYVVFSFSGGAQTPIYAPPERLRRELAARNFTDFVELTGGRGTSLLARKLSASAA
jgi:ubiquinone/menaquinone biosynthesis C-methylase UbiE